MVVGFVVYDALVIVMLFCLLQWCDHYMTFSYFFPLFGQTL